MWILNEAALVIEEDSSILLIDAMSSLEVVYELLRFLARETDAVVKRFTVETRSDWLDTQAEAVYCCDACDAFPMLEGSTNMNDWHDVLLEIVLNATREVLSADVCSYILLDEEIQGVVIHNVTTQSL